jgi:hypothetical protein
MSCSPPAFSRLAVLLSAGCLLSASLAAKAATNLPAASPSVSTGAAPVVTDPSAPPKHALRPPVPKPPISFFRDLLAMSALERENALTNRPVETRQMILAKVHEYESLKPDERELRLSVTELRWYLRPLMTAPATNRPAQLAPIPEKQRKLVEDRLREWDKLPPEVQKDLLENEATLSYLAEIEGRSDEQRRELLNNLSAVRRELLEEGINRWAAMSEDQRQATLNRFNRFFALTVQEKEKVIQALSEPERRQVERMMQVLGKLSPEQRDEYLSSFAKYASLSLTERQEFLRSAEHWKQMSSAEQQAWRELVKRLPPLPPLPHRTPPRPPLPHRSSPAPVVVTNGN